MKYHQKPFALALLVAFFPSSVHSDDNDDICTKSSIVPSDHVWRVDNDIGQTYGGISESSVRWRFDQMLQSSTRHVRHRSRARVYNSPVECTTSGAYSCLVAAYAYPTDPWPDSACYPEFYGLPSTGLVAQAGCDQTGKCFIKLCAESATGQSYFGSTSNFDDTDPEFVIKHELGHVYGLKHVDAGETQCGAANQGCGPGSIYSDGCVNELMCTGACDATSMNYRYGDSRGLRWMNSIGSSSYRQEYRRLFKLTYGGTPDAPGEPSGAYVPNRVSIWRPRIDCAVSTSETNDCAMVRVLRHGTNSNYIQVRRLNGSTSNGWSDFIGVASIYQETSYVPDIAVNDDASVAWVAYTRATDRDRITVARIDIDPSSPDYGNVDYAATDFGTTNPPRIAWAETIDEPVLMFSSTNSGALRLYNLDGSQNFDPMDGIDFYDITHPLLAGVEVTTDFDFDCGYSWPYQYCNQYFCYATDVCGLVARTLNNSTRNGEPELVRWAMVGAGGAPSAEPKVWDSGWTTLNADRINGVIGVTFAPSLELHVEMSESVNNSTDKEQTRYHRYIGLSRTHNFQYQSDMETCSTTAADGTTIPAATPHGGHSIAYCDNCGGGGTIEAFGWGRETSQGTYCW